jgi:hypothetical protein
MSGCLFLLILLLQYESFQTMSRSKEKDLQAPMSNSQENTLDALMVALVNKKT